MLRRLTRCRRLPEIYVYGDGDNGETCTRVSNLKTENPTIAAPSGSLPNKNRRITSATMPALRSISERWSSRPNTV
jgi:hypothetical protein